MKKLLSFLLILCLFLTSCSLSDLPGGDDNQPTDNTEDLSDTQAEKVDDEKTDVPEDLTEKVNTLVIATSEGTENCWAFSGDTLTFSGLTENTVCTLSGEFDGGIVIDATDDYKFELVMCGVTLYSKTQSPIVINSGDKVTLTAKKDTQNFIYDRRAAVSSDDETAYSAAIYSKCDLNIGGKGELTVISEHNNGIHTKDDCEVKNLTLCVTCIDNALKGNDSVTVESGTLLLISKSGDGIKTTNTDVSTKGNQRGTVTLLGGDITIYAGTDGIDASYDAVVSESATLTVYTDKYSPYTEESTSTDTGDANKRYIRFTSKNYSYSVKYYNSATDYVWANATYVKSLSAGMSTYYYYSFDKIDGYSKVQFFIYSSGQSQGQETSYATKSDYMTWNTAYDTFALEQRGSYLSYNWTNYTTTPSSMGGPGGGAGGMNDGNSDKVDYSCKGVKAGNQVTVSGGTILIKSYDDAIHANSESTLENGSTPTGNVNITGGSLSLFSKDDGIHADGTLQITGGNINVSGSYEGLEGVKVQIDGGNISVTSTDDGINSTASSGEGIRFNGGNVYIYAGGDGIDANSRTSYQGIVFAGGEIIVVSTSSNNSSIDTEQGYAYTGGTVLALCPSGGMGSESTKCQNFTSIGTKTTMSLKQNQVLKVKVGGDVKTSVTMPCALSALVIYLGSSGASFTTN